MPKHSIKRDSKPLLLENQTQKRREQAQELRSNRRKGVLWAKRRKSDPQTSTEGHAHQWSQEQLNTVVQGVRQSSLDNILPYLTDLRKLLSLEDNPVEEVVEKAALAPRLIELLEAPNDEIQIETCW